MIAFGQAGDQLAHLVADAHVGPAIGGFTFAMFAICWAWINFTWFASAYDTDDWFFRIATMVQMVGVLILALGLPTMFHAIETGESLGNGVIAAGYVVMRLAMIALWVRVAIQDRRRRHDRADLCGGRGSSPSVAGSDCAVASPTLGVTAVFAAAPADRRGRGPMLAERRTPEPPGMHTISPSGTAC